MSKLKELRTERGYTQESLAKELGLAKGTISSYEQGYRKISVPIAIKLSKVLEVKWTIFFEDEVSVTYDKKK